MITDDFDERTIANMEVALDRACERFPKQLAIHEARKRIAVQILERARQGKRTLKELTDAAILAATLISSENTRSQPPHLNRLPRKNSRHLNSEPPSVSALHAREKA
jgi:hypothetical protein